MNITVLGRLCLKVACNWEITINNHNHAAKERRRGPKGGYGVPPPFPPTAAVDMCVVKWPKLHILNNEALKCCESPSGFALGDRAQ